MLYFRQPGDTIFTLWQPAVPINNVIYPREIETLWTPLELAAIGLYKPFDPGVPDGFVSTGRTVQEVAGVVRFVYDLEAAPAPPAPSTPTLCCMAALTITEGDIGGIDVATGLMMALWIGPGQYWVFFSDPMADYSYVAVAAASAGRANVSLRELEYLEITVVGDDGLPADPAELSVQVYRLL
jgi:hypothetical protein